MEINTDRHGSTLVACAVVERIDGANAGEFEHNLTEIVDDDDRAVLLDLADLVYISSAGLHAILRMAKTLSRRDIGFSLCALSENIRRVFEISGFDKIITIHDSRGEALAKAAT